MDRWLGEGMALKVAITGASGLVGREIAAFFKERGDKMLPLVRIPKAEGVFWSIEPDAWDAALLEGIDMLVHLAGESIAGGRWTEEKKRRIWESRVRGTTSISRAIADLNRPPRLLVTASAVGYYGDRSPEESVDETSASGTGFLADVVRAWEGAAEPAKQAGIRVVQLRLGMVLSKQGGALPQMMLPFYVGLGGPIGDGRHMVSWVSVREIPQMVAHVWEHEDLHGPVNAVAPEPVTHRDFSRTLGKVMRRPAWFPVPRWAIKGVWGEMADELLLSGNRVIPKKLLDSGYSFRYPDLEKALANLLEKA